MIVTVTPNPAVDQTVWVEHLEPGRINRFTRTQLDPAGKGINVSRMVHRLGWPTIAFGFLAGELGVLAERALDDEGVPHGLIRVPGQTRLNTTIVCTATGQATSLYGAGPVIPEEARARLEGMIRFWLQPGPLLVLAGTLPPGMPEDTYATYIRLGKANGVKVILDADGAALRHGIAAGPSMIKPNVQEAEHLLGRPLPDTAAVLAGARELAGQGVAIVVISMGGRGAVCASGERAFVVHAPAVERRSTVGSGDSFVAGLAVGLARGLELEDALRLAAAAGAATATAPGTSLGQRDAVEALGAGVRIEEAPRWC
jgi:1-phosphofructokinase